MVRSVGLASILLSCVACTGPSWSSGLVANSRQVALALGDPYEIGPEEAFDPASVPVFPAPDKVRPCCAFGMDLSGSVGPVRVPIYKIPNIKAVEELGRHGYDKGKLAAENNGLVYTCRGGFIDIAHIRDNADRMLFLTTQIARSLPSGFTFQLPEEGTARRVLVKPLPEGMLARQGRWHIATTLAEWANFQLSVWHEIITWYGWESIKGFSEKVSAFSPEDLYSNAVGQKIAAGIITNRETRSQEEYDEAMDAWIPEALRRLGAVPREYGRQAMKAVDGLWWDSTKALPDNKLVTRRYLNVGPAQAGWIVTDAFPSEKLDPAIAKMCAGQPPPLPLEVPERIGDKRIDELVKLELTFTGWMPEEGFPFPVKKGSSILQSDFPVIVAAIRRDGATAMGADFDQPRSKAPGEKVTANPERASR